MHLNNYKIIQCGIIGKSNEYFDWKNLKKKYVVHETSVYEKIGTNSRYTNLVIACRKLC